MKVELRRSESEIITLMDQGELLQPPTSDEYKRAMMLIANAVDFADNIYNFNLMSSLLYITINGKEVPTTVYTSEELEDWYLSEVQ